MTDTGNSIVEAKKLYTQQLIELLTPHLYDGIKSIFDSSNNEGVTSVLKTFQEKLCSVILWNSSIIDSEFKRIVSKVESEKLINDLIEAVFISNVKVLSSVANKLNGTINIKIPETKNFIHKCYIECARYFFEVPDLMDDRGIHFTVQEIQRNVKRSQLAINNCIEKTIREVLPLQEILENYLNGNNEEEEVNEDTPFGENDNDLPFENNDGEQQIGGTTENTDGEPEDIADSAFMQNPEVLENEENDYSPHLEVTGGSSISDTPTTDLSSFNDNSGDSITPPQFDTKKIVIPTSGANYNDHDQNKSADESPFFDDDE